MAHRAFLLTNLYRCSWCVGGRGFIYTSQVSALRNERSVGRTRISCPIAVGTLAVRRGLQVIFSRDCLIWWRHVQMGERRSWGQGCGRLFYRQVVLNTIPAWPDRGLTLSLTHLMKVGSSSNNDNLSIAWVAQVGCQLPLS